MDALASDDIFLFEGFRLERRGGGLLRRDEHGVFVPVAIGSRAVDVLGVLAERPGDLVLRDEIIAAVWPTTVVGDNNLNMQIAALRRILDDRRSEGSCIQTVAGRGYRFAAAVTRIAVGARAGVTALPESGVGLRPRLSIIVLPFTSLSDDPERPYFADAITEDLATDLSRIGGMLVISPNTAFTYRNKLVDTKQIGRELGVRYLLLGSVQRSENRVRVTARLIDAETDSHLWAERFAGDTGDLFALQDEITSRIAVALNLALVRAEVARPTANPDARDYVLRGRAVLNKPPTHESYAEAIGLFERALELDPWSVQAQSWSALALANRVLGQMAASAEIDIARAEGLVGRALAELPSSPLAHFAKGQILRAQRRFEEAIPEFEMVVAADRNLVWSGWGGPSATITGRRGDPLVRKGPQRQSGTPIRSRLPRLCLRPDRQERTRRRGARRSPQASKQRSVFEPCPVARGGELGGAEDPRSVRNNLYRGSAQSWDTRGMNAGVCGKRSCRPCGKASLRLSKG
jgi:TolB-like protein